MADKVLVVISGGLDSSTLLAQACADYGHERVGALSFTYGARHNERELSCAQWQTRHYDVPWHIIDISQVFTYDEGSALLGHADVPEKDYKEMIAEKNFVTYVPQRNLCLISIASSVAIQTGYNKVWAGMHEGDSEEVYPDCTEAFVKAASEAISLGSGGKVTFQAPWIENHWTKNEIALAALRLGVDIDHTWSCYKGTEKPCGVCGTCRQRAEALAWAYEHSGKEN